MGVKQGCPLSSTLFRLCIDQIKDFIPQTLPQEKDRLAIGMLTLLLLTYAGDVVLFANDIISLQKLVDALHQMWTLVAIKCSKPIDPNYSIGKPNTIELSDQHETQIFYPIDSGKLPNIIDHAQNLPF